MATALSIAKYFINLSNPDTRENITNLKLQKLLYYAQGFSLALKDEKLFDDEIQAWRHGPVVPEIYGKYKKNYYHVITERYNTEDIELTEEEIELVNDVWDIFGLYSGRTLEEMTHLEEPWNKARRGKSSTEPGQDTIHNEIIKSYFKKEYMLND